MTAMAPSPNVLGKFFIDYAIYCNRCANIIEELPLLSQMEEDLEKISPGNTGTVGTMACEFFSKLSSKAAYASDRSAKIPLKKLITQAGPLIAERIQVEAIRDAFRDISIIGSVKRFKGTVFDANKTEMIDSSTAKKLYPQEHYLKCEEALDKANVVAYGYFARFTNYTKNLNRALEQNEMPCQEWPIFTLGLPSASANIPTVVIPKPDFKEVQAEINRISKIFQNANTRCDRLRQVCEERIAVLKGSVARQLEVMDVGTSP